MLFGFYHATNGDLAAGPSCGFTDFVDEGDEILFSNI
jgi:hypothetical protein